MTERCKIKPSIHAQETMDKYDIGMDWVLECVLKGAKRIEKDSLKGNKIVSQHRQFEVVYKKYPCSYYTVSVAWLTKERR